MAVIAALADTESAINSFQRSGERLIAAQDAVKQEEMAMRLTDLRYERGEDDRLAVERQRLALLSSKQSSVLATAERASSAAALYKALGGAWQAFEDENLAAAIWQRPETAKRKAEPEREAARD